MERPEGTPELVMQNPDGSLMTRLIMEQQLRDKIPMVHKKRLYAAHPYGLESNVAFDMKPITVIHWILDRMIQSGHVQGEQMGVSSDLGADNHPENFKQFGQRLALFIENGWATTPHKSEGIDMSKYPTAPPTGFPAAPPNGQTQPGNFVLPAPPAMPGVPVTSAPVAPPPGVYPAAPVMGVVSPAPGVPAPVMAAPVAPQQPATQGQLTCPPPPSKADPQRPWGKASPIRTASQSRPRRNKDEQVEDGAYNTWKETCKAQGMNPADVEAHYAASPAQQAPAPVATAAVPPVMAPMAVPPAPAPMTMQGAPPPPMAVPAPAPMMVPPMAAAPTGVVMPPNPLMMMQGAPTPAPVAAPITSSAPAESHQIAEILDNQASIIAHLKVIDVVVAQILRYNSGVGGEANCMAVLKDLSIPVPQ